MCTGQSLASGVSSFLGTDQRSQGGGIGLFRALGIEVLACSVLHSITHTLLSCRLRRGPVHKPAQLAVPVFVITTDHQQ
jgi:hypothetical protein